MGSCSYELANNFTYAHAGDLDGEVDVTNTGNIGTVIKVKISWPQLGHDPIAMGRTVHSRVGKVKIVPFTRRASYQEISRLQDWQSGHGGEDGCQYHATIIRTFGEPQRR